MVFVAAFCVIIGVNLVLAYSAIKTFPGLEVKNSYVASQKFDERKMAQEALGWTVTAESQGQAGPVDHRCQRRPVEVKELNAVLGSATQVKDDLRARFRFRRHCLCGADGVGRWQLEHPHDGDAADGTEFRQACQCWCKDKPMTATMRPNLLGLSGVSVAPAAERVGRTGRAEGCRASRCRCRRSIARPAFRRLNAR